MASDEQFFAFSGEVSAAGDYSAKAKGEVGAQGPRIGGRAVGSRTPCCALEVSCYARPCCQLPRPSASGMAPTLPNPTQHRNPFAFKHAWLVQLSWIISSLLPESWLTTSRPPAQSATGPQMEVCLPFLCWFAGKQA